jgi:hypothetical protein
MIALVLVQPREARGCLCHYRSPDWQVAHSPLILIGRIEKVEDLHPDPEMDGKGDRTRPSLAHVRIQRILKGRYEQKTVRVRSGPIRSCSPFPCYVHFQVGDHWLFILPVYPEQGETPLMWSGSLRELRDTEMIEARIARCRAYREAYLDEIQSEQPEVFAAATALAKEMREAAKQWPAPRPIIASDVETGFTEFYADPEAAEAKEERLSKRLARAGVEEIRTAQALDWLRDEPRCWVRHPLWLRSLRDCVPELEEQIAAVEKRRIRKLLCHAGLEQRRIEEYLAAIGEERRFSDNLEFPVNWPYWHDDESKVDLTTDFIVSFHSYDRGAMFPAYVGGSPDFCRLNPERITPIVAALWGSDDERLRLLASVVIERVPGTMFVSLVLTNLVENGHVRAWQSLEKRDSDQETAARLAAMIDLASKEYTPWGVATMWSSLRRGECFHNACIRKAIETLAQHEARAERKTQKQEGDGKPVAVEQDEVAVALHQYLDAATRFRKPPEPSSRSAEDYRKWFDGRCRE